MVWRGKNRFDSGVKMNEVEIYDKRRSVVDGKYREKTLVAFFTYEHYEIESNVDVEILKKIQHQWRQEEMDSLLEVHLDGKGSRLTPIGSRPIKSISYVIGEEEYIVGLEKKWKGGGMIVKSILN